MTRNRAFGVLLLCQLAAIAPPALAAPASLPGDMLLPAPAADPSPPANGGPRLQTAVFAGGCFWGIQGLFQHVRGVVATEAGYDGGSADTAQYETVSDGNTGHAESVRIVFDPAQVSFGQLLQVFFSVGLDPTQREGQFPDTGHQYRSVIFATDPAQLQVAHDYVAMLDARRVLPQPIATAVEPDRGFFAAESYHQNFLSLHPDNGYIALYDQPKITALRTLFPDRFRQDPVLVLAAAGANDTAG